VSKLRASASVLLLCALAGREPAAEQYRYETVEFPELLRAHVDAHLGADRLLAVAGGAPVVDPVVYVTATRSHLLLYGETLAVLDRGAVPAGDTRACSSGAPCIPRLRDAIADARAELARATGRRPEVLLLVDRDVPYATLLLLARSAAEARAHLSIRIAARRDGAIVALPVWAAPGRTLELEGAPSPAIIGAEVDGDGGTVTSGGGYLSGPAVARSRDELLDVLGKLQLTSGRNTYFVSGSARATAGDAIALIGAAAEIFPRAVLRASGERTAIIDHM